MKIKKQIINTYVMQRNQGLMLQFVARNSFIKKKIYQINNLVF